MGSLVQEINRVTDQRCRSQRVTANSFRSLRCNAMHGRWPRVWDRCARERSARTRRWCGLAVTYGAKSEILLPLGPRALERLASPVLRFRRGKVCDVWQPINRQHEAADRTDRPSRALPDPGAAE